MISRRLFILAGAATSAHALIWASLGLAQEHDFICATVDEIALDQDEIGVGGGGSGVASAEDEDADVTEFSSALEETGLTPYGTASAASVWRKRDGNTPNGERITLGIHFIDGSAEQHRTVERLASRWLDGPLGDILAFDFGVSQRTAQISILFATNKNSSLIGRDSRDSAKSRPSMHLAQTDERTVCHEFGHALGLRHEHANPSNPVVWNKDVVYADMALQDWTPSMVEHNIFQKFGPEYACLGDPRFNPSSIMLYPIPRRWTRNDLEFGQNTRIGEGDFKCLYALYGA